MIVDKYQKIFLEIKRLAQANHNTSDIFTNKSLTPEQATAIWRIRSARCHCDMDERNMKILGNLYGVEVEI